MLRWVLLFLVVALFAGVLGLGALQVISLDIAKVLFLVFLVLLVIGVLARAIGGGPIRPPIS